MDYKAIGELKKEILIFKNFNKNGLDHSDLIQCSLEWNKIQDYIGLEIPLNLLDDVFAIFSENNLQWKNKCTKLIIENEFFLDPKYKFYSYNHFRKEEREIFFYLLYICKTKKWNLYPRTIKAKYRQDEKSYPNMYKHIIKEYGKFETIVNKLSETIENPSTNERKFKDLLPVNQIESVTIQLNPPLANPLRFTNYELLMGSNVFQSIIRIAVEAANERGQPLLDLIFEQLGIINPEDETLNIKNFSKAFLKIWRQLNPDEPILKISKYLHDIFKICNDKKMHHLHEVPNIEAIRKWIV